MRLLLFFVLNFGALALGSYLMGEGPQGSWYQALNKAPWTPPGWVFGAAWTTIMVAFSFFMAKAVSVPEFKTTAIALFAVQWVLNVLWNPLFFEAHWMGWALLVIGALLLLVAYFAIVAKPHLPVYTWLLTPYILWLSIAVTLNAYALQNNP